MKKNENTKQHKITEALFFPLSRKGFSGIIPFSLMLLGVFLTLSYCISGYAATKITIDDEEYNIYVDEYPDNISNGIFAKFDKAKKNTDDYYLNLTSDESEEKFEKALSSAKINLDESQLTASFDSILFYTDPEGEKDDAKKTDAVTVLCPVPDDAQEHPDDCSVYLVSSGKAKLLTPSVYVDEDGIYYVKLSFPTYGTYGFVYNDPDSYEEEEEEDDEDEPDGNEEEEPDGDEDREAEDASDEADDEVSDSDDNKSKKDESKTKKDSGKKSDDKAEADDNKKTAEDSKKDTDKKSSSDKTDKSKTTKKTSKSETEDEYDYDFADSDDEYYYSDDEYLFDDDDDAPSQKNKGLAKTTFPKNREDANSTQDNFNNQWNNTPTDVTGDTQFSTVEDLYEEDTDDASVNSGAAKVTKAKDSVPKTGDTFPLTETMVIGGLAGLLLLVTIIKIRKK